MARRIISILLGLAVCQTALTRDHIEIVGSSTVFDFAALVAEDFGHKTPYPTPRVESIGSGGGFKRFCAGLGVHYPDITNASRRIKKSEFEHCLSRGVKEIVEVKIGFDGIVLAMANSAKHYDVSSYNLYLALSKYVPAPDGELDVIANPYRLWSDIDADLPSTPILVYGPPQSSGTREAFIDLILSRGCSRQPWIKSLSVVNPERYDLLCHQLREDGVYIAAGENDQMIVQRLQLHGHAMGVFGYGVFLKNTDVLHSVYIDGFAPTQASIASGHYRLARPLYFYIKAAHYGLVSGLKQYAKHFVSQESWGVDGYLAKKGMVPLPALDRIRQRRHIDNNVFIMPDTEGELAFVYGVSNDD